MLRLIFAVDRNQISVSCLVRLNLSPIQIIMYNFNATCSFHVRSERTPNPPHIHTQTQRLPHTHRDTQLARDTLSVKKKSAESD